MRSAGLVVAVVSSVLAWGAPALAKAPDARSVLSRAQPPSVMVEKLGRYVDVDLGLSGRRVLPSIAPMLKPLRAAADHIDRVYWQQRSPEGWEMLQALSSSRQKDAQNLARYLSIHYGPWDWHANDEPFIDSRPRPPGLAFYPTDASRREVDAFARDHFEVAGRIWDPYTVVVRRDGRLDGVPYSEAYAEHLKAAAEALRLASQRHVCGRHDCACGGLVKFLRARAESFLDDDYRKSEMLWLDTSNCPLDLAIGPYEYYEDRLMGLKTAFEAIIYYRDDLETQRYARLTTHHQAMVDQLPLGPAIRDRFRVVPPSPVTVADVLYTAGDARAGYQIRAFILPNDEAVREARGTKNVVLRNVVKANFDTLVKPIATHIFDAQTASRVSFNAYFDFLLAWQLAHTIVPQEVVHPDGTRTSARHQLRARSTFIDAAKGEVLALLNYLALLDRGVLRAVGEEEVIATYLAGLFNSARLAADSPQTIAKAIVYNYLAEHWVLRYNPRTRKFEVNAPALRQAARSLASEILHIIGRGDYTGAGRMIVQYGILPGEVREKLAELHDMPRALVPRYVSMPTP